MVHACTRLCAFFPGTSCVIILIILISILTIIVIITDTLYAVTLLLDSWFPGLRSNAWSVIAMIFSPSFYVSDFASALGWLLLLLLLQSHGPLYSSRRNLECPCCKSTIARAIVSALMPARLQARTL